MKKTCVVCGGDCKQVGTEYKCIYCGAIFEESDFQPKVKQAPVSAPAAGGTVSAGEGLGGDAVYAKVINSIARIHASSNVSSGTSTGFLVSSKGFFLTNAHCVYDSSGAIAKNITVNVNGKTMKAFPVAVGEPLNSAEGKVADLCLLFADGDYSGCHINSFGDYREVKNGQREYIVGDPFGEGICITSGIVSDRARTLSGIDHPFLMTDAATNPGNSGGPHYNSNGEVIGVHVAGRNKSEGMNYAVPINVAEAFISEVVKHPKLMNVDFGELNKYKSPQTQSATFVISGIKLLLDVVDYIISVFNRK